MAGPFDGVRIVDLTTMLMGPLATQFLADLGADVIKVEPPAGDLVRQIGPHRSEGMGPLHLTLNRNKRSIVLDLKQPQGREALLALVEGADALVYNVRPQAMERLGLGYDAVRARNPQVVYCGAYGFAQQGPYAARPAYDELIEGAVGIPALAQRMTGTPSYAPFSIADHFCGMHAAFCLSAALYHRKATGLGQALEVTMFEAMAQTVLTHHLYGKAFVPPLGEAGYPRQISPDRKPYRTLDGHVCMLLFTDAQWRRFFEAAGRNDLAVDARFVDVSGRNRNTAALYEWLAGVMAGRSTAEWLALFAQIDIAAMAMNTLDDLLADPHLAATGFLQQVEHPTEGTLLATRLASNWSGSVPQEHRGPAPLLGQHSAEVLAEAGYTADDIDALATARVTGAPPARKAAP
ncbi:MAG: CoA transferase [Ramlibacter sp.]|nr:CoA transferase [Ramlibacter sp.]